MFLYPNNPSLGFQFFNILRILLGLLFLFSAVNSLRRSKSILVDFERWSYPKIFLSFVGLWQLTGGILLLSLTWTYQGTFLLIALMFGAIYTHLKHDPWKTAIPAFIIGVLMLIISWNFRWQNEADLKSLAGDRNIQSCLSCHGIDPFAPRLEGLSYDYMVEQVEAFKLGKRGFARDDLNGQRMALAMKGKTSGDVAPILAYFSVQDSLPVKRTVKSPLALKGEALYLKSCQGCHGTELSRVVTSSPNLDALTAEYIGSQMQSFRKNWRAPILSNKHKEKMKVISQTLSEEDLENLAAYFTELKIKQ